MTNILEVGVELNITTTVHDANALADWLAEAKPRDAAIYHTGFLAFDMDDPKRPVQERAEIATLARCAMEWCEQGRLALVQVIRRKTRYGAQRDYVAIKLPTTKTGGR